MEHIHFRANSGCYQVFFVTSVLHLKVLCGSVVELRKVKAFPVVPVNFTGRTIAIPRVIKTELFSLFQSNLVAVTQLLQEMQR